MAIEMNGFVLVFPITVMYTGFLSAKCVNNMMVERTKDKIKIM